MWSLAFKPTDNVPISPGVAKRHRWPQRFSPSFLVTNKFVCAECATSRTGNASSWDLNRSGLQTVVACGIGTRKRKRKTIRGLSGTTRYKVALSWWRFSVPAHSDRREPSIEVNTRDWETHRRLAAEGRLNLLFRLSEPLASRLKNSAPQERSNVLPFISREDHLFWRNRWTQGRFVKLAWTPDERLTLVQQDKVFRDADVEWERRHPRPTASAVVVPFASASRRR
jgi:hypothetical protein